MSDRASRATAARLAARAHLRLPPVYPADLPITSRTDEIVAALAAHQVLVVAGETGSGKSTQIPKICLEAGRGSAGMIGHTQPRRIAARSVAERIAEELEVPFGGPVGYKVRFTDKVTEGTLVKVMTDGVLLAELHTDRELRNYDTLIIDEAHERSLNIDFILGYLKRLLPLRPDLKVIITSATIDTERFSQHFDGAPVIAVSGRTYPVEIRYRPYGDTPRADADDDPSEAGADEGSADDTADRVADDSAGGKGPRVAVANRPADTGDDAMDEVQAVCDAVSELCGEGPGDILVFLPGEREIRDAADALSKRALRDVEVLPLYGRLSSADQHRIFERHSGRRAVLATNVAETSLTVPGIRYVVDSGTARISRYSRRTKVQRLPIEAISQASANQRAGRCGRLGPGVCVRLYAKDDYESRRPFTEPEVLRTNLASVVLQMAAIGLGEIEDFPFVEPPDRRNIKDGITLLEELGAFLPALPDDRADPGGRAPAWRLSGLGRKLAQFPLDPRLGRMVLEADRLGCLEEVLVIVAGLSVQDPRERPAEKRDAANELHSRFAVTGSDFVSYLSLWGYLEQRQAELSSSQFRRMCKREMISYQRAREWQDVHNQLTDICRQVRLAVVRQAEPELDTKQSAAVHQALLSGLVSQVGYREGERVDFAGTRGSRFTLWAASVLAKKPPRWVMAAELVETSRLWARVVAPIKPEWLERAAAHLLKWSYGEPSWDAERGGAMLLARATLYGLPVVAGRRVDLAGFDAEEARELFIRYALVEGDWGGAPDFVERGRQTLDRVTALLQRARRNDLMVGDEALARFYGSRLPVTVTSGPTFNSWWREQRSLGPEVMEASPDDLMGRPSVDVDLVAFPDTWSGGGSSPLALTYNWQPGSEDDGVRVEVPLAQLNRLAGEGLEWQVPGLREELVVELLRSLPKDVRRHLVPMPAHAREFVAKASPADGPLLAVLARHISAVTEVVVSARDFDWSKVPVHLKPTFSVIGEQGQVLATGKQVADLMAQLRPQLERALQVAASSTELGEYQRGHFTTWEFADLPTVFEPGWHGYRLRGYPALQDEGDAVTVRVFPDEVSQRAAMAAGTRRLLLLNLGQRRHLVDSMENLLGNQSRLALAALTALPQPPYRTSKELAEDIVVSAVDAVVVDNGGPSWTAEGFAKLSLAVRNEVDTQARAAVRVAARILSQTRQLHQKVDELAQRSGALPAGSPARVAVADIDQQLGSLVGPRFVRLAGARRLSDIERYLTALDRRVEKLPATPGRDLAFTQRLQVIQGRLAEARQAARIEGYPPAAAQALDEARWLIEELRVSFFAQSLGTRVPVSEERVLLAVQRAKSLSDMGT